MSFNTLDLKPGDKIGVFFYDDTRGSKAEIHEVDKVSSKGFVTLKDGTRYNAKGKEIGAYSDATYLCSVEKAISVIEKALLRKGKTEAEYQAYLESPEGKQETCAREAVGALIKVLNQNGWYADVDGHLDVLESEIRTKVEKYLSEHDPV
ncbi:hypothetical protein NIES4071_108260 (plasmid) [Calothrix sp. NIES-4071]|nr:hypothetical protein NIES4071_108260 [Calothrix sp. NIES-4071]BAZ64866.1 hypothetical protein NIES4105_105990 [Calothrix sp. NIES-4105]